MNPRTAAPPSAGTTVAPAGEVPAASGPVATTPGAGPQPRPAPRPHRRHDDVTLGDAVGRVYRFLYNKRTGLALILAMAVGTLLGTLFMQAPDGVRADPGAYASWLDSVRPRYGGWTPVLSALGMFGVYSSVWFKAITVGLAASIIACTAHRVPQLWQRAVHPHTHVTEGFFDHARYRATADVPAPPEEALAAARAELRRRHFRVLEDQRGPGRNLYADRHRFGPWGTVISHASFVLILLGVLISSAFGLDDQLYVTVGTSESVGHGTDLVVEARSFSDTYTEAGEPLDYVSELALYDGGELVEQREVRVNSPLRHDGFKFHQATFGVAAVVRIEDDGGATVLDAGVPLLWTSPDGTNAIGRVDLPEEGLEVIVVTPASGQVGSRLSPGELQVEVYDAGEGAPADVATVVQGESVTLGGLTYTFERERQYTGLIVSRDPGTIWVWIGSALLVLGMTMTFGLPHRRVWVRAHAAGTGSRLRLGSAEKQDSRYEAWFQDLARTVTSGGAAAEPPLAPAAEPARK